MPAPGNLAPDFILTNQKLCDVSLADYAGKRKLLVIVPSVDAPICVASARRFNEKAGKLANTVALLISADLPFAQCRVCTTEQLHELEALSCFRSDFADLYGLKLIDGPLATLCARAVIIIDEQDRILYSELVTELGKEPDYDLALSVLQIP